MHLYWKQKDIICCLNNQVPHLVTLLKMYTFDQYGSIFPKDQIICYIFPDLVSSPIMVLSQVSNNPTMQHNDSKYLTYHHGLSINVCYFSPWTVSDEVFWWAGPTSAFTQALSTTPSGQTRAKHTAWAFGRRRPTTRGRGRRLVINTSVVWRENKRVG